MLQKNVIEVSSGHWDWTSHNLCLTDAKPWWAVVLGLTEGMASSAGAYWMNTVDGHGFRTTVVVQPPNETRAR